MTKYHGIIYAEFTFEDEGDGSKAYADLVENPSLSFKVKRYRDDT